MRWIAILSLLLITSCADDESNKNTSSDTAGPVFCQLSPEKRTELLAMQPADFDFYGNGWKKEFYGKGCEDARLIGLLVDEYRETKEELVREKHGDEGFLWLYWHAGQLYGFSGMNELAHKRLKTAFDINNNPGTDWVFEYYARATLAFFEGDLETIKEMQRLQEKALAENPKFDPKHGAHVHFRAKIASFIKCFGQSYYKAYLHCDVAE